MDTILSIISCKLLLSIKGVSHGRYRKNGEVVGREVLLYSRIYACLYDDALILVFYAVRHLKIRYTVLKEMRVTALHYRRYAQ